MLVPFSQLPDHARIWIYPSNRKFTDIEISQLHSDVEQFLIEWTAHGSLLHAGYCIPHHQFIVLALNEDDQKATGCSIDKSVHFIQSLEQSLAVTLLDKMNVNFIENDVIKTIDLKVFKKRAKAKGISPKTIVFNHLVTTKVDFENHWETTAGQSWHSRFF